MANTVTALNPEFWSKRMQVVRIDEPTFEAIANMEERAVLSKGDTVHRPYRSGLRVQDYTKGTDIVATDLSATDESLSVDQSKIVSFYFDDIDDTQNGYDTQASFADDAGRKLYSYVDGEFLAEVLNATQTIDDGDINGGTAGNPFTVSSANVVSVFSTGKKFLKRANAKMSNLVGVFSPSFMQALWERVEGKDTAFGDSTSKNGMIGSYAGVEIYESNNLPYSARWTPANQPTNGATITIDGVVFNLVTTIGSTPGNVLIEVDTATTIDNLVAFINNPTATTSKQVAFTSVADLDKVERMTATDGTTYLGIVYNGGSEATVASSEVADVWSLQTVHQYLGEKGAIDMVIQMAPKVQFKDDPDRLGKNVHTHTLYGKKTFAEGAAVMLDVQVNAASL